MLNIEQALISGYSDTNCPLFMIYESCRRSLWTTLLITASWTKSFLERIPIDFLGYWKDTNGKFRIILNFIKILKELIQILIEKEDKLSLPEELKTLTQVLVNNTFNNGLLNKQISRKNPHWFSGIFKDTNGKFRIFYNFIRILKDWKFFLFFYQTYFTV